MSLDSVRVRQNRPSHAVEILYLPRRSHARKRSGIIKAESILSMPVDTRSIVYQTARISINAWDARRKLLSSRSFNASMTRVECAIRLIKLRLFSFIMKINDCLRERTDRWNDPTPRRSRREIFRQAPSRLAGNIFVHPARASLLNIT